MALVRAVLGQVWSGLWLSEFLSQAQLSPAVSNKQLALLSCGCTGEAQGRCCSVVLSCDSVVGLVNMFFLLVTLICSLDQKPGLWQFSEPPCHWWWWQMDVGDLS